MMKAITSHIHFTAQHKTRLSQTHVLKVVNFIQIVLNSDSKSTPLPYEFQTN